MPSLNTAAVDAMLKVVTDGPLFDSVVGHSDLIDLYEQNSNVVQTQQGRYVELAHMFGYNEGVGARQQGDFLPVPGNPTFVNGRVKLKKTVAVAQMTHEVMKMAVQGRAAFADWAEVELTKTEKVLRWELDRQAMGFGAGALCRLDGAPNTTTKVATIDAPYGLASDTKGWLPGIRRGKRIVAGPNIDGSSLRANGLSAIVLSVSKSANSGGGSLTLDRVPDGWADNDYLFSGDDLGNSAAQQGVDTEMQGFLGMVDDGTILVRFQNISRTDYDEWKCQVIDGSIAPYSALAPDTLFMHMNDDAVELGGSDGLTHILVSRAVFRNVYVQQQALGLGTGPNSGQQTLGTKGISVRLGTRIVEIRPVAKIFPGMALGLDRSTLRRYHLEGFEWDDTTGAIFKQVGTSGGIKDEFYAYGRTMMELGCTDPQKNVKVTGLSESQA